MNERLSSSFKSGHDQDAAVPEFLLAQMQLEAIGPNPYYRTKYENLAKVLEHVVYRLGTGKPQIVFLTTGSGTGKTITRERIEKWLNTHPKLAQKQINWTSLQLDDIEDMMGSLAASILEFGYAVTLSHIPDSVLLQVINIMANLVLPPGASAEMQSQYINTALPGLLAAIPYRYLPDAAHADTVHSNYPYDKDLFLQFVNALLLHRVCEILDTGYQLVLVEASAGLKVGSSERRKYPNNFPNQLQQICHLPVDVWYCSIAADLIVQAVHKMLRSALQQSPTAEDAAHAARVLMGGQSLCNVQDVAKLAAGGSLEVVAYVDAITRRLLQDFGSMLGIAEQQSKLYAVVLAQVGSTEFAELQVLIAGNQPKHIIRQEWGQTFCELVLEARYLYRNQLVTPLQAVQFLQLSVQSLLAAAIHQRVINESEVVGYFHAYNTAPPLQNERTILAQTLVPTLVAQYLEKFNGFLAAERTKR